MAKKSTMGENLYLQLIKGRLGQWKKEAIEGETRPIKNDEGVVTGHAVYYESMEGKLHELGIYEKEFKAGSGQYTEMLVIKLKGDGKGLEILETEFKGSHSVDFLTRLPNIDLERSMELKAFTIKDEEKSKKKGKNIFNRSLVPYQGKGEKVARFFTKENPHGMPDADVTELKNKKGQKGEPAKEYDFSKREDFLRGLVAEYNEKIKALRATSKEVETEEVSLDDLPM